MSLTIAHNMRKLGVTHNMRENGMTKHVSAVHKQTCSHKMGMNVCMEYNKHARLTKDKARDEESIRQK